MYFKKKIVNTGQSKMKVKQNRNEALLKDHWKKGKMSKHKMIKTIANRISVRLWIASRMAYPIEKTNNRDSATISASQKGEISSGPNVWMKAYGANTGVGEKMPENLSASNQLSIPGTQNAAAQKIPINVMTTSNSDRLSLKTTR
jgi:hypothetical protein